MNDERVRLAVIQPTAFCNIDCSYCYLPNRLDTHSLDLTTLGRIYDRLFEFSGVVGRLPIVWHAGEPLVAGIDFYRQAFCLGEDKRPDSLELVQCIQTNGTLITDEWCELFAEHEVQIGLSLDGPQWIHDGERVDRQGRGTFNRVMAGIERLRSHGIAFHVIAVLTPISLAEPDAIWDFFRDLEISEISFNVEETQVENTSSLVGTQAEEKYAAFLARILERREREAPWVFLREVDPFVSFIDRGARQMRSSENSPFAILSFDSRGNISTFSPEFLTMRDPLYEAFTFGNVIDTPIAAITTNDSFVKLWGDIRQGVSACEKTCDYFRVCGGGAPVNKLSENGTLASTETLYCRLRTKVPTNVVLDDLESRLIGEPVCPT